jgi:hypothetical protein
MKKSVSENLPRFQVEDAAADAARLYKPRPIEFAARVWAAGYRWEGRGAKRRLTPAPQKTDTWRDDGPPITAADHQPLREHSGLFKTFANVDPNAAAIKRFANQYGGLLDAAAGETFSVWISEIEMLRLAIALTEARTREEARTAIETATKANANYDFDPEVMRDFAATPLWLVRNLANRRLEQHTTSVCLSSPDAGRLTLALRPRNLLGALWLQFIQAVEGNAKFRKCAVCGEPFEVSGHRNRGKHAHAIYCSGRCKVAAYRRRQEPKPAGPKTRQVKVKADAKQTGQKLEDSPSFARQRGDEAEAGQGARRSP